MNIISRIPCLNLCLLIIFLSPNFHLSLLTDRITANKSLSGDQTIVSSGGVFKLGFFKPGNALKYYIGIWYNRLPQQTVVWVANRDKPVSDRFSSALAIYNGSLVLFNELLHPVWSTEIDQVPLRYANSSSKSNGTEAVLLDNGNFILNGSVLKAPLWQSFDYPTDTLLPGAKFRDYGIRSWRTKKDPAPGLFSLWYGDSGASPNFILLNNNDFTSVYQISILSSKMRLYPIYIFSYITNADGGYFTYSLYNDSILSRLVMDAGGRIQLQYWIESTNQWNSSWSQPENLCELYNYCGCFSICSNNSQSVCHCLTGFDPKSVDDWNSGVYFGGCVRRKSLQCGNSGLVNRKKDGFLAAYNLNLVVIPIPQLVTVRSTRECEWHCLNNCSCTAYAYGYDNDQCWIWIQDLINLQKLAGGNPSGKTIYVRLAGSELSNFKNNKRVVFELVGICLAVVIVLVAGLVLFVISKKKRSKMRKVIDCSLTSFGYRDLKVATRNFSEKLGSGGFGSVFKGTLLDSSVIAVKKLESTGQEGKQFRAEIGTLGMVQHVNLVRLRGFCCKESKKLLVYDYAHNGSLNSHIFHEKVLDWKTRYNVALGTARGLAYLHEKCRDCIIHFDIKPENILLDAEFCPKVADFGLAKLVGREFSRVLTTMRGTRGYLAPEWLSGVPITAKADVYSYGMVLFELVSGRRNTEKPEDKTVNYFPAWVARQINEGGDLLRLLDPKLSRIADLDELTRICKVACWCIQDDETQRPTMGQIVLILEGVLNVNDSPPIPRYLQDVFYDEDSRTHISLHSIIT